MLGYYRVKNVVHGIAHITGGGLCENLERILPEGIQVVIGRGSWPVPPVFTWLQRLGEVEQEEMDQVFNMGIGLVLVVAPFYAESIRHQLTGAGLDELADRPGTEGAAGRGMGKNVARTLSGPRPWEEGLVGCVRVGRMASTGQLCERKPSNCNDL